MTTEVPQAVSAPLVEKQMKAAQNYMALLNEISAIGTEGFFVLIDTRTEDELNALLQACDTVYQQIQKFKTRAV